MNALILYLSLTGRTKKVAEILAAELTNYEVDIEPIVFNKGRKGFKFHAERNKLMAGDWFSFTYDERIFDLNPYDLICLGVPTWGGIPAFVFDAYIEKCTTLDGKAVVIFNTCRFISHNTIKNMKNGIEEKSGHIINQKTFKGLFRIGEKKPREFGKIINEQKL